MLIDIIRKDLKLILRSKTSTAAILLAPILIILLVGIAFSNSGTLKLSIGTVNADSAPTYSDSLNKHFETYDFTSEKTCEEYVQRGIINACVVFDNSTASANILVDPSNLQLVSAVEQAVSGTLQNQAATQGIASADVVLGNMAKSRYKLEEDSALLTKAVGTATQLKSLLGTTPNIAGDDSSSLQDTQNTISDLITRTQQIQTLAIQGLNNYEQYVSTKETDQDTESQLRTNIESLKDQINQLQDENTQVQTQLTDALTSAQDTIQTTNAKTQQLITQQANAAALGNSLANDINTAAASMSATAAQLGTITVNEQNLVTPLAINVTPVIAKSDNFAFVFQFFFVLTIMFSAILLASSITVRERTSRAYFRNAASPTPDYIFATGTFVSVLIIILFQTGILYFASFFLTNINLFGSIFTSLVIITLVSSIFILIGMAIGYLLQTQEASIVGSITATSIFLLLSPIILPLETLPAFFRFIAGANPFVIGSDLLKNAVLFDFSLFALPKLWVLVIYGGILAGLIFVLQRFTATWALERRTADTIADYVAGLDIPEDKLLRLGERTIRNKEQLLHALRTMDDEEFESYVTVYRNPIADWVTDVYKNHKLADTLRNKNRLGHIHYLEKK